MHDVSIKVKENVIDKMAVYTDLPLYEECYQLFLQFTQLSQKMQRDFRYSIGEDVKRAIMTMIVDVYKANYKKNNNALMWVEDAQIRLVEIKVMLRMLNELRQLPDRHFALLLEREVVIGGQLDKWEISLMKNNIQQRN